MSGPLEASAIGQRILNSPARLAGKLRRDLLARHGCNSHMAHLLDLLSDRELVERYLAHTRRGEVKVSEEKNHDG